MYNMDLLAVRSLSIKVSSLGMERFFWLQESVAMTFFQCPMVVRSKEAYTFKSQYIKMVMSTDSFSKLVALGRIYCY